MPKLLTQYRLTLHHTDGHEPGIVAQSIQNVCHLPADTSLNLATQASRDGTSALIECHMEKAELLVHRLAKENLDVRMQTLESKVDTASDSQKQSAPQADVNPADCVNRKDQG